MTEQKTIEMNMATVRKFLAESNKRASKDAAQLMQKEISNYCRKLVMQANNYATLSGNKTIMIEHMTKAVNEFSELVAMPELVVSTADNEKESA